MSVARTFTERYDLVEKRLGMLAHPCYAQNTRMHKRWRVVLGDAVELQAGCSSMPQKKLAVREVDVGSREPTCRAFGAVRSIFNPRHRE